MLVAASVGITLSTGTPLRALWQRAAQALLASLAVAGAGTLVAATTVGSPTWPWDSWPTAVQLAGLTLIAALATLTLVLLIRAWTKTRGWMLMWARWLSPEA